jgi:hypothetical protein
VPWPTLHQANKLKSSGKQMFSIIPVMLRGFRLRPTGAVTFDRALFGNEARSVPPPAEELRVESRDPSCDRAQTLSLQCVTCFIRWLPTDPCVASGLTRGAQRPGPPCSIRLEEKQTQKSNGINKNRAKIGKRQSPNSSTIGTGKSLGIDFTPAGVPKSGKWD